jgi:hypothetical protein
MRIRRTMFGLGVFFFGVGITLSGAVAGYASLSSSLLTTTPLSLLYDAFASFLLAALLLAWSFRD